MKQQVPLLSAIAMAAMIATAGAQTAGERYFEGMKRLTEFTGRQDFCLTMARNPLRLRVEGNTLSNMPRTCRDRKSTLLNSSHSQISYALFFFKKKNTS